jgi:hypothetical protein
MLPVQYHVFSTQYCECDALCTSTMYSTVLQYFTKIPDLFYVLPRCLKGFATMHLCILHTPEFSIVKNHVNHLCVSCETHNVEVQFISIVEN